MSVYVFVSHLYSVNFNQHVSSSICDVWKVHSTEMGNLACDFLFRMPACDVIRYTLFKVTSFDELDARTSSCNDSETALTNPFEYMYPL